MLHIHAGLAVMLIASLLSGRALGHPFPLIAVVLAEGANEVMDYHYWNAWMPDTASDIMLTLFWPVAIFMTVRLRSTMGRVIRPSFPRRRRG
ncbi:hypothetical protein [Sphingobium sp.]|uniref:hypothetical protein n=1 Tax=Sphingobium sp. TaxID=1912891 RepID=UPI003B3B18E3